MRLVEAGHAWAEFERLCHREDVRAVRVERHATAPFIAYIERRRPVHVTSAYGNTPGEAIFRAKREAFGE